MFQSTHPHGVRPASCPVDMDQIQFQSTHPHGVRRYPYLFRFFSYGFNPRTHTGCDVRSKRGVSYLNQVSIHAPTRGATQCGLGSYPVVISFNPRTHTGCDITLCFYPAPVYRFNPRTHTGCDYICIQIFQPLTVSIHAPTRGATSQSATSFGVSKFQSTHPHGVRPRYFDSEGVATKRFQSTHPHGVRRIRQYA